MQVYLNFILTAPVTVPKSPPGAPPTVASTEFRTSDTFILDRRRSLLADKVASAPSGGGGPAATAPPWFADAGAHTCLADVPCRSREGWPYSDADPVAAYRRPTAGDALGAALAGASVAAPAARSRFTRGRGALDVGPFTLPNFKPLAQIVDTYLLQIQNAISDFLNLRYTFQARFSQANPLAPGSRMHLPLTLCAGDPVRGPVCSRAHRGAGTAERGRQGCHDPGAAAATHSLCCGRTASAWSAAGRRRPGPSHVRTALQKYARFGFEYEIGVKEDVLAAVTPAGGQAATIPIGVLAQYIPLPKARPTGVQTANCKQPGNTHVPRWCPTSFRPSSSTWTSRSFSPSPFSCSLGWTGPGPRPVGVAG